MIREQSTEGLNPVLCDIHGICLILCISESTARLRIREGVIPKPMKIGGGARWRVADIKKIAGVGELSGRAETEAVPVNRTQPIIADRAYALDDFKAHAGLGRAAFSTALKDGLVARRVGKRRYVLGSDWIKFLAEKAAVVDG